MYKIFAKRGTWTALLFAFALVACDSTGVGSENSVLASLTSKRAQVYILPADTCFETNGGTITRYKQSESRCDFTAISIPSTIRGTPITAIGDDAFRFSKPPAI